MQSFVPVIPESAPFSAEQRAWLNGYLAGLCARAPAPASPVPGLAVPAQTLTPLTILFGSQTGTAEGLAKRAAKEAGKRGFAPTVIEMSQTDLARLSSEKHVLAIVSTYGDGEPPDNAKALWKTLGDTAGTPLLSLRFSVCALGDTNYVQFCQCGKDFDSRFEKLGAKRVASRVDCDLDQDDKFAQWLNSAFAGFSSGEAGLSPASLAPASSEKTASAHSVSEYSRTNPFSALLLTSRNLNADGSAKEVRHVEFDLSGSGLNYEAGDALGVYAQNCPEQVSEILSLLGCDGEEAVTAADGSTTSFRQALAHHYDLGKPSPELVSEYALRSARSTTATLTAEPLHVVDVLLHYPEARLSPSDFVARLKRLQPRLYSISSSPLAHTGQVHLTVGAVRYEANGRARKGLCSTYLAERVVAGATPVRVFVHPNKSFRPPSNPAAPMIMVGPGTGIAPFRGFLHHRKAQKASGKNWLFFGDQRASTDFLYRDELENLKAEGILHRLDTAFSRDQADKIYVQHRMIENAVELYTWLENGAHFYVCGDATRMAKDVDRALHEVIQKAGGKTAEEAINYVEQLKAAKRYARDVY